MNTPRIEVDLSAIRQNARHLVDRLSPFGISVVGVTKGVCGHPQIARAMLDGGVAALGDARMANVERMRAAGITAPIVLIRTPMLSQVKRVVRSCGTSLNVDFGIITALAEAAVRAGRIHRIILMVEMGDGREGLPPGMVPEIARQVMGLAGVSLAGIGANFACLSDRAPGPAAMRVLAQLAADTERMCGISIEVISGGNSASLNGSLAGTSSSHITQLRLGEAILLGRDPLTHRPIDGLATDAFTVVAEIIEFATPAPISDRDKHGTIVRRASGETTGRKCLLALGDQDTDVGALSMPEGLTLLGSTSDHLVVHTAGQALTVGSEVRFQPGYAALMRAMSAPDVAVRFLDRDDSNDRSLRRDRHLDLESA